MSATGEVIIQNKVGLHARPAALFVRTAASFSSRITLENLTKGTAPANAKSILSVLTASARQSDHIRITADGADEQDAIEALSNLVNTKFGEQE